LQLLEKLSNIYPPHPSWRKEKEGDEETDYFGVYMGEEGNLEKKTVGWLSARVTFP
jgi:hypothetical protein